MKTCAFIPNFLKFYNIIWQAALPFLRRNQRLASSFSRRTETGHLIQADIWMQAASAGEAFLALSIIETLAPNRPVKVLVTTTTDQGMKILEQGLKASPCHPHVQATLDWFPFDMPDTINAAVQRVNPKVMVLLETELWPALLWALKQNKAKILVLNARMSAKSSRHYRMTRKLWSCLAPDRILATSPRDAIRYAQVFSHTSVDTMDNIKFDIMETSSTDSSNSSLEPLLPEGLPLSIIASVRRQEEPDMIQLISRLMKEFPAQVIAIFPRHMHRIGPIQKQLRKNQLNFFLGSQLNAPLPGPGIVLWDRFGELRAAYGHGTTVFVGGSLRSLGGQNFLEPAVLGIPTVIGPHWSDFAWVGKGLFEEKIVTQCPNHGEVARAMVSHLKSLKNTSDSAKQAAAYIKTRRGGSQTACLAILNALKNN